MIRLSAVCWVRAADVARVRITDDVVEVVCDSESTYDGTYDVEVPEGSSPEAVALAIVRLVEIETGSGGE